MALCDGTTVDTGKIIGISSYALGRMKHVWGPDAMEYKPERWIHLKTDKVIAVSPYKFNTFNAGPRVCLGIRHAMMEMKIVIASVLAKYRLSAVPGQQVTNGAGLALPMKNGFSVTMTLA